MLSADDLDFVDGGWIEQQKNALNTYSEKIESCIISSEWETLAMVLESRYAFIRQLFSSELSGQRRAVLKPLADAVLEQDTLFQARVEEQKQIAVQQQMTIRQARRAVNAYNNQ